MRSKEKTYKDGVRDLEKVLCKEFHEAEERIKHDPRISSYLQGDGDIDFDKVVSDNDLEAKDIVVLGMFGGITLMHAVAHQFTEKQESVSNLDRISRALPKDLPEEVKDALLNLAKLADEINGKK